MQETDDNKLIRAAVCSKMKCKIMIHDATKSSLG